MREEALWRSARDAWAGQGGEPVEVLERNDDGPEPEYRIRFADGEVMWAPADEVDFELSPAPPPSLAAAQSAIEGFHDERSCSGLQDFRDDPAIAAREALVISDAIPSTSDDGIEILECEAAAAAE